MNSNLIEIKKIVDTVNNMTIEEYEEIYERINNSENVHVNLEYINKENKS